MPAAAARRHSYAEYLALEAATEDKHEFCDGIIVAMAGGTILHSVLKTSLALAVGDALRGRDCRPFDSDLHLRVPATSLATYPDLTVIRGPVARDTDDPHAVTNPTVLFEVLSASTAGYERGGWERRGYDLGQAVPLPSVDVVLALDEVYARWRDERALEQATLAR
ncbi:MAG: Uma2 family endonuclease [Myxococcales bacterium]|nr:Uma2 family endonuclease [Myxococcales bacterium]